MVKTTREKIQSLPSRWLSPSRLDDDPSRESVSELSSDWWSRHKNENISCDGRSYLISRLMYAHVAWNRSKSIDLPKNLKPLSTSMMFDDPTPKPIVVSGHWQLYSRDLMNTYPGQSLTLSLDYVRLSPRSNNHPWDCESDDSDHGNNNEAVHMPTSV